MSLEAVDACVNVLKTWRKRWKSESGNAPAGGVKVEDQLRQLVNENDKCPATVEHLLERYPLSQAIGTSFDPSAKLRENYFEKAPRPATVFWNAMRKVFYMRRARDWRDGIPYSVRYDGEWSVGVTPSGVDLATLPGPAPLNGWIAPRFISRLKISPILAWS